jgi:hypothetical protein
MFSRASSTPAARTHASCAPRCRAVGRRALLAAQRHGTAHHDDPAAAARPHLRQHGANEARQRIDEMREDAPPLVVVDAADRRRRRGTGQMRDQHLDDPGLLDDAGGERRLIAEGPRIGADVGAERLEHALQRRPHEVVRLRDQHAATLQVEEPHVRSPARD